MALNLDNNGWPILLADVPNSGAATVDVDAASGNPQHDTSSGKFAKGSAQGDPVEGLPANTDPNSYFRQRDAIRDLAREMDEMDQGDIQDFLAARVTRPLEEAEIQQLLIMVRHQRIDDLVDMLDYQFRGLIDGVKRGRRRVSVKAPRGWIRKTFNSLTDDEVLSVINRLEARGHQRKDLQTTVIGRIKKQDRADSIGARLSELPDSGEGLDLAQYVEMTEDEDNSIHLSDVLDTLKKQSEQPIIINVNVENKTTKKKLIRNPETGLIDSIEDIEK